MKRNLIGILAIVIAISGAAFTAPQHLKSNTAGRQNLVNHYYQFTGTDPLNISSYTELLDGGGTTADQKYAALGCNAVNIMCGIVTNTTTPTLTDNGRGFPAVNSTVSQSDQKN